MRRFLFGVLLAALALPALGQTEAAVRKTAESSTLVTGTVVVDEKGAVSQLEIDQPDKFTPAILNFVKSSAALWRFEPQAVDGKLVRIRNKFSIRLAAQEHEDGTYKIRIAGADFRPARSEPSPMKSRRKLDAAELAALPRDIPVLIERVAITYPELGARVGAHGMAYIAVKIGRDGRILDATARQVNLGVVGPEREMEVLRREFASAAVHSIKKWRVSYPTEGESVDQPYLVSQVTVEFLIDDMQSPEYGEWRAYIPGPEQPLPWPDLEAGPSFSPDAVAGSDLRPFGEKGALKLLTPLEG